MTTSLRERRRQALHEDILDAARNILAEKGYNAMSMDDLAAQAGISKPTLYSYFATKDEIVTAAIVREIDRLLVMTEPGELAGTPLQRMTRILETVVQLQMREQRQPIRMWMPEMHKLGCEHPKLLNAIEQLDRSLTALVGEAIAGGEIDAEFDPASVVRIFYALVTAVIRTPHSARNDFDPLTAPRLIARVFRRGIQAAQSPQEDAHGNQLAD